MIDYVITEGKDQLKVRLPEEFQFAYNNGDITYAETQVADIELNFIDTTTVSYTEAYTAGAGADYVEGGTVGTFADISTEEVAKFNLVEADIAKDGTVTKVYFDRFLDVFAIGNITVVNPEA